MTVNVLQVSSAQAYDLIYSEYLSSLSSIAQETMQRAMDNSEQIYAGFDDDKILAIWGLIPPTLLSDRAYLWMWAIPELNEHVFVFIRHSQRLIEYMLQHYPIIVGHGVVGNTRSLRWLRWLGAEFGNPQGQFLPFEIRAKSWPQASEQLA